MDGEKLGARMQVGTQKSQGGQGHDGSGHLDQKATHPFTSARHGQ